MHGQVRLKRLFVVSLPMQRATAPLIPARQDTAASPSSTNPSAQDTEKLAPLAIVLDKGLTSPFSIAGLEQESGRHLVLTKTN